MGPLARNLASLLVVLSTDPAQVHVGPGRDDMANDRLVTAIVKLVM
jgi:hypothetical protein